MTVLTLFLIIIAVIGAIVAIPAAFASAQNYRNRLNENQRAELRESRAVLRAIERAAAQNKGINDADSILANQVESILYDFKTKELG